MKILLFANTDWYLYNFRLPLARALAAAGHQVLLVSPPGAYAAKLEQAGFHWRSFPLARRGLNPFAELVSVARLRRLYRAERPDLAHHFTVKCVLYGSLAARTLGKSAPAVVNAITGLGYVFVNRGALASVLRAIVRPLFRLALRGSQVIFQNPDDQAAFLRMGLAQAGQTALVRGSGVDLARYTPQPQPAGTPLVILPGRLLWDKGVGEFVEAAGTLRARGLAARFALVGQSDPSNPAAVPDSQLRAWQQSGVVECWGWREDMPAVLAEAAIVCLPSYREGTPKALLEAGACARAVVATDVPGCREVVQDGENGLLVPPRDAAALAEALAALLADPARCARMGVAGRARVENGFDAAAVSRQTMQVYHRAVKGQGKA